MLCKELEHDYEIGRTAVGIFFSVLTQFGILKVVINFFFFILLLQCLVGEY